MSAPLSTQRLLYGALVSPWVAAAIPWLAIALLLDTHWDIFAAASLIGFTLISLIIGAVVGFLILWPVALLLENSRFLAGWGLVFTGTTAWPLIALVACRLFANPSSTREYLVVAAASSAIGLLSSLAFALVSGASFVSGLHHKGGA